MFGNHRDGQPFLSPGLVKFSFIKDYFQNLLPVLISWCIARFCTIVQFKKQEKHLWGSVTFSN